MPTFTVQFPDGAKYDVDAPEGTTDAQAYEYAVSHIASLPDPITRQSTFGEEVERGVARTLEAKRLAVEQLLGDDSNQAIIDSIARGQETAEGLGVGPSLERLTNIAKTEGYASAAAKLPSDISRYGGSQVGVLGTLGTGARLASWLMPGGALLKGLAGGLGGISALTPDLAASSMERLAQEQMARGEEVDVDVGEAYKYAAMQAALEAGGTALFLGKSLVRAITGIGRSTATNTARQADALRRAAQQSTSSTVARGLARGAPEIPIEIGQQILERDFAGLDLLSDEALSEYGEAAYLAGLVGGSFGVTGSFTDRLMAGQATAPTPQEDAIEAIQKVLAEPDALGDTPPEQTVAQATGQETTVGDTETTDTETTTTETTDTETTDTETTDTETTDTGTTETTDTETTETTTTENREETRKAKEEARKDKEAEDVEAATTATEENAERQRAAERAYAEDIAARREAARREAADTVAPERTAERAYAEDMAARRKEGTTVAPERTAERAYAQDIAARREAGDTVVVVDKKNGREEQLYANFAARLTEEEIGKTVVDETVVDETVVDETVVDETGVDRVDPNPLLTEQGLRDAGISKAGLKKLAGTGAFVEGIELTNENINAQAAALTAYAAGGVSKAQSDKALAQAERLANEIESRAKVADDQILDEEGNAVDIADLDEGVDADLDEDVVRANQEAQEAEGGNALNEELVDADVQVLQDELATNPSGDVATYLDPEPSIGGLIEELVYAIDLEQQERVEAWMETNLSKKSNNEYKLAKRNLWESLEKEDGSYGDMDLLLDSVSKLAAPINPEVMQALREGNLTQALAALRASQGRKNRDVARLISALSKAVGTTRVELRSNVVDQFGRPAAGYFSPRTNTIVINQDVAISSHTLLHEVTHAVVSAQLATNSPAARQMKALFESVKDRLGTAYGAQDVDEFVAEAWGNPEFRAELGRIAVDSKGTTALQRFLNSVMNMIRSIRGLPTKPINSAQSEVDVLMEELIAPAPEFRNADDMYLASTPKAQQNILTGTLKAAVGKVTDVDIDQVNDFIGNTPSKMSKTLGVLPLDSIARLVEREFPAMAAAIRELFSIINQKRGGRNQYLEKIRGTAREVKAAFKNDPEARILFGELATESTRLGYDPTRTLETYQKFYHTHFTPGTYGKVSSEGFDTAAERDADLALEKAKPELKGVRFLRRDPEEDATTRWQYVRDMYAKLNKDQQRAYATLRDAYSEVFEELKFTLIRRLDAIEADPALKTDFRNKILYEILYRQEISPYFPLSRKGNLWLTYEGLDPYTGGVGTYKETFTTAADRNRRIRELRADPIFRQDIAQLFPQGGGDIDSDSFFTTRDVSEQDNFSELVNTDFAYSLLRQVRDSGSSAVEAAKQKARAANKTPAEVSAAGAATTQGRQQMEEILLEAIVKASPERSLLRTFRPRAGTLGYETDAITTFEERMPIFANQVNTLRYALPLEQIGMKIKETAALEGGTANRQEYAKSVAEHVQNYITFAQNPNIAAWSKVAKSLTFLWTLGFNVASAVINLFILPTVVFAYLGGKYGYTKTMRYMIRNIGRYFQTGSSRAIKRFGGAPQDTNKWQGPGLGNPDYTAADLPEGLGEYSILANVLIEEGYDTATTIGDMLDADTPMATSINNVMGYVFNQSERLNRHVTAMTHYDLEIEVQTEAKGRPLTDEEKKAIARESILEAEYTNSGASIDTAPTISQNSVGSLAFMYKRFGVSMMFFQIRTMFDSLNYIGRTVLGKGAATETLGGRKLGKEEQERIALERKQALKQGAMLFASSALLAGAQGVPMIGAARFFWNMSKEDDDEDFDSALKGWVGGEPIFYEGVLNEITGADIAPRIAMNQLLYRSTPNQAEQSIMEWGAEQLGGPALSLVSRMLGENGTLELWKDAATQNNPDLFYRGLERAAPAAGGNIMRFARYVNKGGAQNLRGDFILEDVTTGGLVGQLFGFAPAAYTRQLEQNARDKSIDMAISAQKTNLLKRLNVAQRFRRPDNTVEEDIRDFNRRHPETAITPDTRRRSANAYKSMNVTMGTGPGGFSGVSISPRRQATVLQERLDAAGDLF